MLLRTALAVLHDASPLGLIGAAAACLCQAADEGLRLPAGTPEALWNVVRRHPDARWASLVSGCLGEIATPEVVTAVIEAVRQPNAGVAVRDAALDVLSGPAAAQHVSDHDLLDLAERARGRLVLRAEGVVRSVAQTRRLHHAVLAAIVESWLRRPDKTAKLAAVDLVDVLDRPIAQGVVSRALSDEIADVRASAASKLPELYDQDAGLAVVKRCMNVERDAHVVSELLAAMSVLVAKRSDAL